MVKDAEPSRVSSTVAPPQVGPSEIFNALGDPVRWSIICQIAEVSELGCSVLEDTLSVSKPTISYHTKILVQAGLLNVRKEGRNFYYTLRRDVLRALVDAPGEPCHGNSQVIGVHCQIDLPSRRAPVGREADHRPGPRIVAEPDTGETRLHRRRKCLHRAADQAEPVCGRIEAKQHRPLGDDR